MYNVILSVIGILLAGASSLFVIDYGGDYFMRAYQKADMAVLTNAGANVKAAYSIYRQQRGRTPGSINDLLSSADVANSLRQIPRVDGIGATSSHWAVLDRGRGAERAFVITGVSDVLCAAVNERVNHLAADAPLPTAPAFAEGCMSNDGANLYYLFLDAAQPGDPVPA